MHYLGLLVLEPPSAGLLDRVLASSPGLGRKVSATVHGCSSQLLTESMSTTARRPCYDARLSQFSTIERLVGITTAPMQHEGMQSTLVCG